MHYLFFDTRGVGKKKKKKTASSLVTGKRAQVVLLLLLLLKAADLEMKRGVDATLPAVSEQASVLKS